MAVDTPETKAHEPLGQLNSSKLAAVALGVGPVKPPSGEYDGLLRLRLDNYRALSMKPSKLLRLIATLPCCLR
jgi:hypothetical protein